jgi:hypothetical protein
VSASTCIVKSCPDELTRAYPYFIGLTPKVSHLGLDLTLQCLINQV